MKVLMITSEYPSVKAPFNVPFIVRQIEFLRKKGVEVEVLSFRGAKNPFNYLLTFFRVQKKLITGSFDLVHAQFGQSGIFTAFNRIPMVVTFRGSDLEGIIGKHGQYTFAGRILQLISRIVARRSKDIILVAASMSPYLPQKCTYHVIPSGLDLSMFKPMNKTDCRQQLGWPLEEKIIVFGGRPYVKRKRFGLAKEALNLIKTKALMKSLDDVVPEMMPIIMNAGDALLLTSLHEGSPNVVKEALACNTPIISVRVGDVEERLRQVKGCYICENDSPREIAQGIDLVLSNLDQPFEGRKHVEHLSEDILTDQVIGIYKKIIS